MFSFYRKTSPAAIAAPPSKGEFCVAVRQYLFEQALNSNINNFKFKLNIALIRYTLCHRSASQTPNILTQFL